MKGRAYWFLGVGLAVINTMSLGCSSYMKRQKCNEINWFQHGYNVARSGYRLDADTTLQTCRQVDADVQEAELDKGFKMGMAEYCKLNTAYDEGRKGRRFEFEMCDHSSGRRLAERHAAGVKVFCEPENGFRFGANGGEYNSICPADLEPAFLARFRQGRKKYLIVHVDLKETRIRELDRLIADQERQKLNINRLLTGLAAAPKVKQREYLSEAGATGRRETVALIEDPAVATRRMDLENQLRRIDAGINSAREEQRTLSQEVQKMKAERAGLDGDDP